VVNKEICARYYIFFVSVWIGVIILPFEISTRIIKISGAIIILSGVLVMGLDLVLTFFMHVKRVVAAEDRYMRHMPDDITEICDALSYLAGHRIGGLVILERKVHLDNYIGGGIPYDAQIKSEILTALFAKSSPVHDGAVIVAHGRLKRVKAVLPLSTNTALPMGVGTRHRSAIGITEKTDAIALIASEERGELSVAYRGELVKAESQNDVLRLLHAALKGKNISLVKH